MHLQLDDRSHIEVKEFRKLNWLPVSKRFNKHLCSNAFKCFSGSFPLYLHDIYKKSGQH